MLEEKYVFEGMSQFRPPLCRELAHRSLHLVMDNRREYDVSFLSGDTVQWGETGGQVHTDHYDCLKVDDDVYFMNLEIAGRTPRTGLALAIDYENMLVTCVVAWQDETGRDAYFTKTEIVFGAIRRPDGTVNTRRHAYTADHVGKAICWTYNPRFAIIHTYPSERYFGNILVYYEDDLNKPIMQALSEPGRKIPWTNGPWDQADWVKIKEGIYLFSFVEAFYPTEIKIPKRNCLSFVFNLKRLQNFGRLFGMNDDGHKENYMFAAFGRYVDMEPLTAPQENDYLV